MTRPWSEAELRALRKLYPRARWDEILRALPRRKRTTIWEKARTLGVRRVEYRRRTGAAVRVWDAAQDALLRQMWPEHTRRTICARLKRRWIAVLRHADELGLTGEGSSRWAGYISIHEAARRAGYTRPSFMLALSAYQEHFRAIPAGPERSELASPSIVHRGKPGPSARLLVDAQAALDAVEWWLRLETASVAAARLGMRYRALLAAARAQNAGLRKYERRAPEWWDAIAARASRPGVVRAVASTDARRAA